jgi:protein-tyrosine phosphatase
MTSEWLRFKQVTKHVPSGHKLYRASAPNYAYRQKLTASAVQFLADNGIDSIISFNEHPYNDSEKELLANAKIEYKHLPVKDFHAPTLETLYSANEFFLQRESTLVHCGYGHGRTGTGLTGLQLYATKGALPLEGDWTEENHVETEQQVAVLRELRNTLKQ